MSTQLSERARRPRARGDLDAGVDVLDLAGPAPTPRRTDRRRRNVFERIWTFLISMRTGLIAILVLGVLTLIGTLVMQATPEAASDPEVFRQWYEAGPRLKYGGWAPVLSALGLYDVFGTWYFRALFAFLAVSILACSANRAPRLWRTATRPRVAMSEAFFSHAPLRAALDLPVDAEAAAQRVRAGLRAKRLRAVEQPGKDGELHLYADRFRWGPFGTVVAHLSFVIILAGFVVSASMGFRDEQFIAPIDVVTEVGHGTGLSVLAHSFHDDYYEDGSPKDYVSDIELFRDGVPLARQNIRVNEPLIHDDVWFHQSFFGVGADVVVREGGTQVFGETVALGWRSNDGTRSIGQFALPGKGISVYVVQAASGQVLADLPAGSIALEIQREGQASPEVRVLDPGASVEAAGLTWTFERNRQYTGITVKRDPGSNVVWAGTILLILGSTMVFFLPHRRLWVRVRPLGDGTSRVLLGAALKRDPGMEPAFEELLHHLQGDDAPQGH